jgi:hypothetical protein
MKLRRVDPRKIKWPEVRVTAQMTPETAEQFKASVKEIGIDEPIKVFDIEGELWGSDGKHRWDEAILNNLPVVEVTVREGTMVDVLCNNIMSGHLRGKHPVSQMRKVIESLYKEHQVGIDDIVKRTGFTRNYVENLLLVSELTPLVLAALDQEKIGLNIALLLAKFKDPKEQEKHFWMQQNYHLTFEMFKGYLKDYEAVLVQQGAPPPPPVTKPPTTVKCAYCGEAYPPLEMASVITCRECAGIMYQAIAQARRDAEKIAAATTVPAEVPKEVP